MDSSMLALMLGVLGMILVDVLAYLVDRRSFILGIRMIGMVFWMGHFYVLGVYSAVLNLMIALCFTLLCYFRTSLPYKNSLAYPVSFFVLNTFLSYLSFQGIASLFTYISTSLGIYGKWQMRTSVIRKTTFVGLCCWLCHNIIIGSGIAMFSDVVGLTSVLIAMYRFDIKKQKPVTQEVDG